MSRSGKSQTEGTYRSYVDNNNVVKMDDEKEMDDNVKKLIKLAINDQEQDEKSKSKFYFPFDNQEVQSRVSSSTNAQEEETEFDLYEYEEAVYELKKAICCYSPRNISNFKHSSSGSSNKSESIDIRGRLLLTNFRLIFIPFKTSLDYLREVCFQPHKLYQLFNIPGSSFQLPLMHITEMRVSLNSSEKPRKVSAISDILLVTPKDLLIKCKNFQTKHFIFLDILNMEESIRKFTQSLISHSNNQTIILNRFQALITTFNNKNDDDDDDDTNDFETKEKSYMLTCHLVEDLSEYGCDDYMEVKNGSTSFNVFEYTKFVITNRMPFCAMPKRLKSILGVSRVVTNEVADFGDVQAQEPSKKSSNRFSEFLTGSSRSGSFSPMQTLPATGATSSNVNAQSGQPSKASVSATNPFSDNRFPVWTFTDVFTDCSLIIVPEASTPNRQDECDIIIKNYNAFLVDEVIKLRMKNDTNTINSFLKLKRVSNEEYGEYEFFKFKVPFTHEKVRSSFRRLADLCMYRSSSEFIREESEQISSFYKNLHASKWLKYVNKLVSMTSKIIACLHIHQRNVFLVEANGESNDCSCLLSSLVKICFHARHRTIVGFENLIRHDWFLAGHAFKERLLVPATDMDEGEDNDENSESKGAAGSSGKKAIAPIFLLFLDCVFQLTIQYPKSFEFNELYLIHLWDYSISGISFTFSFNGLSDWLYYVNKMLKCPTGNYNDCLQRLYATNRSFWRNHMREHRHLLVNNEWSETPDNLILNPCDRMYLIKFWSRCYLRWYEMRHAYNEFINYLPIEETLRKISTVSLEPPNYHPPAPPFEVDNNNGYNVIDKEIIEDIEHEETATVSATSCLKATTRVSSQGDIHTAL